MCVCVCAFDKFPAIKQKKRTRKYLEYFGKEGTPIGNKWLRFSLVYQTHNASITRLHNHLKDTCHTRDTLEAPYPPRSKSCVTFEVFQKKCDPRNSMDAYSVWVVGASLLYTLASQDNLGFHSYRCAVPIWFD